MPKGSRMDEEQIYSAGRGMSGGFGFWGHELLEEGFGYEPSEWKEINADPEQKALFDKMGEPEEYVAAWVRALRSLGWPDADIVYYGDWKDGRHIADQGFGMAPGEFEAYVKKHARDLAEVQRENEAHYGEPYVRLKGQGATASLLEGREGDDQLARLKAAMRKSAAKSQSQKFLKTSIIEDRMEDDDPLEDPFDLEDELLTDIEALAEGEGVGVSVEMTGSDYMGDDVWDVTFEVILTGAPAAVEGLVEDFRKTHGKGEGLFSESAGRRGMRRGAQAEEDVCELCQKRPGPFRGDAQAFLCAECYRKYEEKGEAAFGATAADRRARWLKGESWKGGPAGGDEDLENELDDMWAEADRYADYLPAEVRQMIEDDWDGEEDIRSFLEGQGVDEDEAKGHFAKALRRERKASLKRKAAYGWKSVKMDARDMAQAAADVKSAADAEDAEGTGRAIEEVDAILSGGLQGAFELNDDGEYVLAASGRGMARTAGMTFQGMRMPDPEVGWTVQGPDGLTGTVVDWDEKGVFVKIDGVVPEDYYKQYSTYMLDSRERWGIEEPDVYRIRAGDGFWHGKWQLFDAEGNYIKPYTSGSLSQRAAGHKGEGWTPEADKLSGLMDDIREDVAYILQRDPEASDMDVVEYVLDNDSQTRTKLYDVVMEAAHMAIGSADVTRGEE